MNTFWYIMIGLGAAWMAVMVTLCVMVWFGAYIDDKKNSRDL